MTAKILNFPTQLSYIVSKEKLTGAIKEIRKLINCNCPASPGERCPLTAEECEVRWQRNKSKPENDGIALTCIPYTDEIRAGENKLIDKIKSGAMTASTTPEVFIRDGKTWGQRGNDGKIHFQADTPKEVLEQAMLEKIAFSLDIELKPSGEKLAVLDNERINRKLKNKNTW